MVSRRMEAQWSGLSGHGDRGDRLVVVEGVWRWVLTSVCGNAGEEDDGLVAAEGRR